jgi:hypothetical protein
MPGEPRKRFSLDHYETRGTVVNATQYVAALKRGLKDAVGVIEALDSMTPRSREFETEVLKPLRDLLKLKPSPCPVCGKTRKLTSACPQHE